MYYFSLIYYELNPLDIFFYFQIGLKQAILKTIYIELLLWMSQSFQQNNPIPHAGNLQQKNLKIDFLCIHVFKVLMNLKNDAN